MPLLTNGRYAAIFFLCVGVTSFAGAQTLSYKLESGTGQGLLTNDYWARQSMTTDAKAMTGYADSQVKAKAQVFGTDVFVEKRQQSVLHATQNVMVLAANNELNLGQLSNGVYPLAAEMRKFEYTAVGVTWGNLQSLSDFQWSWSPKVVKINQFKLNQGDGQIKLASNTAQLQANIYSQGQQTFAFDPFAKQLDMGYGFSNDASLSYKKDDWSVHWTGINIFSSVEVNGLFFIQKNYQVNQANGKITSSDIPSLTGSYGQVKQKLKLPAINDIKLSHASPQSPWRQELGAVVILDNVIPWASASYQWRDYLVQTKTFNLQNLRLTIAKQNFVLPRLSLEVMMETAFQAKPQAAVTSLVYSF